MIKEINEQPQNLRHIEASKQQEVETLAQMITEATDVYVTGCGTANTPEWRRSICSLASQASA